MKEIKVELKLDVTKEQLKKILKLIKSIKEKGGK
jgi:hypothetical protein